MGGILKRLKSDEHDSIIAIDYIFPLLNGKISIQEIPYIKESVIDRVVSKMGNLTAEDIDVIESLKIEMKNM